MKQILSHQIIESNRTIKQRPFVFLHGLYGFKSNLRGIARLLSSNNYLNNDRDFILMDLRNHGNSFHSNIMSLEHMAQDVVNTLEYLSIDEAIWFGHSLGGKISMLASLYFPSFVYGLIIADIAPVKHDMQRYLHLSQILKSMPINNNNKNKYEYIDWLLPHLPEFSRFELEFLLTNLVKDKDVDNNDNNNNNNKWKWRVNFEGISDNIELISGFNANGLKYEQDTLFIGGSKANYLCPKYHLPSIKNIFPNSEIKMLCASHYLHIEKQKELTDLIFDYVCDIQQYQ